MTVLLTERLRLAPIEESDVAALLRLFNEPDVGRYLLDGTTVTEEWVEEEVRASHARFRGSTAGLWALRLWLREHGMPDEGDGTGGSGGDGSADGGILGIVGYRPFFDPPELQLLYALHPSAWGKGLAVEAAAAAVDHGFAVLGFQEIRAATDAPNRASIRVLERLGMSRWKAESGEPWETVYFRIRREEWSR